MGQQPHWPSSAAPWGRGRGGGALGEVSSRKGLRRQDRPLPPSLPLPEAGGAAASQSQPHQPQRMKGLTRSSNNPCRLLRAVAGALEGRAWGEPARGFWSPPVRSEHPLSSVEGGGNLKGPFWFAGQMLFFFFFLKASPEQDSGFRSLSPL